jgi:hypothetical protein
MECFRLIDLDKKAVITPKIMQQYLMYFSEEVDLKNISMSPSQFPGTTQSMRIKNHT